MKEECEGEARTKEFSNHVLRIDWAGKSAKTRTIAFVYSWKDHLKFTVAPGESKRGISVGKDHVIGLELDKVCSFLKY